MTTRRKFLAQSTLAATALAVSGPAKSIAKITNHFSSFTGNQNVFQLLHTANIKCHITADPSHAVYPGKGGFSNLSAAISALKKKNPGIVLLDCGNTFSGNSSDYPQHKETIKGMKDLGYEATLTGTMDLAGNQATFYKHISENRLPLIAGSETFTDPELQNYVLPYKIIQRGNIKIGIITSLNKMVHSELPGTYGNIPGTIGYISSNATFLKREKKCHIVICLSQLGYLNNELIDDLQLARQSENIDIILGGNSNVFMRQPSIILNKNSEEVIINHTGDSGIILGNIEIHFDAAGNKKMVTFRNQLIGAKSNQWVPTLQNIC